MEDRDFRVGDKVTCMKSRRHGVVKFIHPVDCTYRVLVGFDKADDDYDFEYDFLMTGEDTPTNGFVVLFHGHLDLDDIQNYIESKEQKPVRAVTKYVNIWCDRFGTICCSMHRDKMNAEDAANSNIIYKCIAHPIEVTE